MLQKGAPTCLWLFQICSLFLFVSSPLLPELKFPSLSDVKVFLPRLIFLSEDGSHEIGGVSELVVIARHFMKPWVQVPAPLKLIRWYIPVILALSK